MAYYSSNYYADDNGEYSFTPCYNPYYDSAPLQDSSGPYSNNRFKEHNFFSYDPAPFLPAYDLAANYSRIAYSASTFSEPKYIEYDPASTYYTQTQFIVNYSVSEFNFPEFEELDPTPYGGGYDPVLTYGKPLPPSDEICYPRSMPHQNGSTLNGIPGGAILAPFGEQGVEQKEVAKPQGEINAIPAKVADQQPPEHANGPGNLQDKPSDMEQDEVSKEEYNDGRYQIPSGYGLEAVDFCESLFGYWPPCLSRYGRRSGDDCQETADYGSNDNYWKETAEYLFGSSNPYSERRDNGVGYGNAIYGYERQHYQERPPYQQDEYVEYVEDSWSG